VPRFRRLSGRHSRFESDLAEELQNHIENRTLHLTESGLSPDDAARQARMEFGSLDAAKDDCRSTRSFEPLRLAFRNVGWAFRRAARAPWFAAAVIVTLAIGIASVSLSAMLVYETLLRPLPFVAPQEVGLIWMVEPRGGTAWLSVPEFDQLHRDLPVMASVEAATDERVQLLIDGRGREIQGLAVSYGFLSLLGLRPSLGRDFTRSDDTAGSPPTVILSRVLWESQFGGDPAVIGRAIQINERAHTVIGVLPASFVMPPATSVMPEEIEFLLPLEPNIAVRDRSARILQVFTRRHSNSSFVESESGLTAYAKLMFDDFPDVYRAGAWRFRVTPFHSFVVKRSRTPLLLLLLLSGLILATAWVNATNLLLVRGERRRKETSIRAALGATRLHLAAELIAEVWLLVLLAGIGSFLLIHVALPALRTLSAGALPNLVWTSPPALRVLFPMVLSLATATWMVVMPVAKQATLIHFHEYGRGTTRSRASAAWGRRLAAVQIALATATAAIALCLHSRFQQLQRVDLGFVTRTTITARLSLTRRYADDQAAERFLESTIQRVKATPGVLAVGAITQLPLSGATLGSTFLLIGDQSMKPRQFDTDLRGVTPGYFHAAGMTMIAGRDFGSGDSAQSPGVAIVDETFAHQLAPSGNALGQRIRWIRAPGRELRIVGIVHAVRHRGPTDTAVATVYRPYAQYSRRSFYLLARTNGSRLSADSLIGNAVSSMDPAQPVADVQSMEQRWSRATGRQRLSLAVGSALALVSLLLSGAGVYSVLAFDISQRLGEFGIRIAIGADPSSIPRMVLREIAPAILLGVIAGVFGAAIVAVELRQTEFWPSNGVAAAVGFGAVGTLLVAFEASWLPARAAATILPRAALTAESAYGRG
jgi:predicted permease